ncbi:xanthine dehydrogenase family protein molybdopterin-binding subunit [Candidatus Dormiibacter inghamiae]|uniref:xanthine dehydrogenase family protein molybdopterin-binding subunit n=1 Tax=Candidatus Dormiibacter inghamiae TaxID=3127013 RepID=UPI0030C762D3
MLRPDLADLGAPAGLGAAIRRREDPELFRGEGRFLADLELPAGGLFACFVRSPVAHARLKDVDLGNARALAGVVGAFAAKDLGLEPVTMFPGLPEALARPVLAKSVVRFAGEAVAVVVGRSEAAAADGAAAVAVDYEPLSSVVSPEDAAAIGAPLLFPEHGSNLAFQGLIRTEEDALAGANAIISARFRNQRLAAVPMEPNGFAAAPLGRGEGLQVWASTQSPFQVRDAIAESLRIPEQSVHCMVPHVGGAFGAKLAVYPEQLVVAALALRLGRPVRWLETRSESFVALNQGRGQIQDVQLGSDRSGKLVGLRVRVIADAGAYPGQGAFLPYLTGQMLSGVYRIPRIDYQARSYCTNTTPTGAYRGAGRPEATALLERAMDLLAAALGLDPAELRRRNLIPPDAFPYESPTGAIYDSGDYERALGRALQLSRYADLRSEQAARLSAGARKVLGIGISTYVEVTAVGSPTEYAAIEVEAGGDLAVQVGTTSSGQGHATAYAQILSGLLGVPSERITVTEGDTSLVERGDGTASSRSMQLGASAVFGAGKELLQRARELGAEVLEAAEVDLVSSSDGFGVRGSPQRAVSWSQLAARAAELGSPLRAVFDAYADSSYPFGAHVAVAEVDLETGEARLLRHVAVDDCGTVVNPLLVDGQVAGGIAQGVAQALFEEVVHDADGIPRTTSLLDYCVPGASELPPLELDHTVTASPNNSLGVKGVGESGTIGATPAVQNAVLDAVKHLGIVHLDMPLHPERLWRAIRDAPTSR